MARAQPGSLWAVPFLVALVCLRQSYGPGASPVVSLHVTSQLNGPSFHGDSGLQEGRSFSPASCLGLEVPEDRSTLLWLKNKVPILTAST